jgi:antitoxin component HigA of HigAB toxin-antitoxin module
MQNKPNFESTQMNISSFLTKDYENEPRFLASGKQTQSNPISVLKTRIAVYNYLVAAVKKTTF